MVQTQLPGVFVHPFSPAARRDPYPALAWLRENAPLFRDQHSGMYYATGHDSVTQILRDRRFSAAGGQLERDRHEPLPPLMLNTDPPEHQRLRAPGLLLLGPAAVAGHLGSVAGEATALLDGLAARDEAEVAGEPGERGPDDQVLDRTPNPHLAFGGGGHFCLAGPLVRGAAGVLLRELGRRFPAARLAPGEQPEWSDSLVPRRVRRLRVILR